MSGNARDASAEDVIDGVDVIVNGTVWGWLPIIAGRISVDPNGTDGPADEEAS